MTAVPETTEMDVVVETGAKTEDHSAVEEEADVVGDEKVATAWAEADMVGDEDVAVDPIFDVEITSSCLYHSAICVLG